MHFDLKIYQERYGYPKIMAIKCFLAVVIVSGAVIAIARYAGKEMSTGIVITMVIIGLLGLVGMAVAIFQCADDISKAKQMKVTLNKGKLYVKVVWEDGFQWGVGDVRVVEQYDILTEDIKHIRLTHCFIEIHGKMSCKLTIDGCSDRTDTMVCKIPRAITGEEKILALARVKEARDTTINKPKGKKKRRT